MIYLDTSAILKLLRRETETDALIGHLETYAKQELITSALTTVETARALVAVGATTVADDSVRDSGRINLTENVTIPTIAITGAILDRARALPPAVLRSLDAIHVATAMLLGAELDHVITYDRRMTAAAEAAGLQTAAPA